MKLFQRNPSFYKGVFALALPIALQSLISIGVNMLDTIMVGSLGETALSATSLANSFISIYHIFCMGLGMGASVLVSRYWGMKKAGDGREEEAGRALKQTVCLMLRITVGLAAIFALLTLIMPSTLMKMYTSDEEIIRLGDVYFRWSVITYFFLGTGLVSTIVLRSVGQVRLPLYVSIGAFFVNLGANYAFIFGKFGAPRMEVAGAALGTLIARLFEAAMILGYLFLKDKNIRFRIRDLFMKTGSLLGEYIRISIPVLVSDAILAIGNNSVAMVIGHLGAAFVAANAITSVTQQLSSCNSGSFTGWRDRYRPDTWPWRPPQNNGSGLDVLWTWTRSRSNFRSIHYGSKPPYYFNLQCQRGNCKNRRAAHGRNQHYHNFPRHKQHYDKGSSAWRW